MRYLVFLLFPLLLFSKPFKVASYNVENLFDANHQGTEYEEYIPGKHNWTKRMAEIKLDHTTEVLCDLDADIVALQEIENESVFNALQKRLKRVGCPYRYSAITHKKGAPIQVALLSRFPLKKHRDLQVSFSPYVRNILEVEAEVDGYPLTIFANHWKSKSRKGVESKRIAYARTLEKRILSMPASKEYIILGDLNSNYDAYLTLPKKLNDTQGKTGINHILKTIDNNKLISKSQIRKAPEGMHYSTWNELSYKERWSHRFYGHRSTLDHILLPPSMFDGKGIDYVNNSFRVFKTDRLFTSKGYINRWQIKNGKHTGRGYSDHLPVYAIFDTKPYIPSVKDMPEKATVGSIEDLYKMNQLDHPIVLEDVVVILKRGRYAVVKQSPKGRGIFIFGVVKGMKEGMKLDLRVQEISTYKGLKEIMALVKLKEKGTADLIPYYASLDVMKQNEVVRNLVGVVKNGYLYVNGKKISLYFKNRKLTPQNGSKIKIDYAHLGYYKKLQLVIYSKKDFTILKD
ncbi:endonuclease/exonuclease/phosphatase family protein [Sulfurovum sp. NBC37-1]|uniref:endonuclease/exonuclease/phosphatase family protein n=1 Tax=Sulfurovum sp. (strain NBC37-1) TaxID=387093 RepID=UPI0001587B71|nr:endonuclease/exonuclease/phosphatase family protein [Sulfurovum sp. NBC37-1]BAF72797.1 conserved hypothetical protein [Sulfurovum sp. NBC37-1]